MLVCSPPPALSRRPCHEDPLTNICAHRIAGAATSASCSLPKRRASFAQAATAPGTSPLPSPIAAWRHARRSSRASKRPANGPRNSDRATRTPPRRWRTRRRQCRIRSAPPSREGHGGGDGGACGIAAAHQHRHASQRRERMGGRDHVAAEHRRARRGVSRIVIDGAHKEFQLDDRASLRGIVAGDGAGAQIGV
jgi:hypothetical protein